MKRDTTVHDRVTVALVEDEGLFRDLLRTVLSQHPRLAVVGAFPNAESALEAIPALCPRVAILDIELGGAMNGVQLGLQLRRQLPDLGIILLTNHVEPRLLASLPPETASGWSYLLKKSISDVDALERAIEGAAAGFVVLDQQVVSGMQPHAGSPISHLTPRQREILALIAQGYTNATIAEQLVLAEKSVENQINLMYQQLGIDRRDRTIHPRVKAVLMCVSESRTAAA